MPLRRLSVTNLRNLLNVDISPGPHLNVIYGVNGSGKTSLLEAISLLGLGRSFRTHRPKPLINYHQDVLTLFGEVVSGSKSTRMGLQKTRVGETQIKVDGSSVLSAAQLAVHLPTLCLNADSFELLTGPPKPRRQLLDWLVFHVEPRFLAAWRDFQQCLKHRNSLLRHGKMPRSELASWDHQMIPLASAIDEYRRTQFTHLRKQIKATQNLLPEVGEVELAYRRGWSEDVDYGESLTQHLEQDLSRGHTHVGPHRADIRITVNGMPAAEILSRGQQKSVVSALVIAQGLVFRAMAKRDCVYLVDDLPAELDENHRKRLGEWLEALEAQVFVTGVEKAALMSMWSNNARNEIQVFHVERGTLQLETQ